MKEPLGSEVRMDEVENVTTFPVKRFARDEAGHMTIEEFRERYRRIKLGNKGQQQARLLSEAYENGEGLEKRKLAAEIKRTEHYTAQLILFGDFLRWADEELISCSDALLTLNLSQFLRIWDDTQQFGQHGLRLTPGRFKAILAAVEQMDSPKERTKKEKELAEALLLSDLPRGRKLTIETILEALPNKYDQPKVESFLRSIRHKPRFTLQTKHYPLTKWALYEVPKGRNPLGKDARIINLDVLQKALKPEIKRLMEMGKTHNMRISCEEIRKIAMSIEQKMKDFSVERT